MASIGAAEVDGKKSSGYRYSQVGIDDGLEGERVALKRTTLVLLCAILACLGLAWHKFLGPAHGLVDASAGGRPMPAVSQALRHGTPAPRLHFLFLAMTDVPHSREWSSFLAGAPAGSWTVWLHCKNRTACSAGDFMRNVPNARLIPSVPTTYCKDLVSAEVQLLKYALRGDAAVPRSEADKFVVLSDSTLPLKSFPEVYATLTGHKESDFCVYPVDEWYLWKNLSANTRAYIVAHSQFVQLNRRDASLFVERWQADRGGRPWRNMSFLDNETRRSQARTRYRAEEPSWTVPLLDGKSNAKVLKTEGFDGYEFCVDELVPFSVIFGAVVFDAVEHRRVIDGYGTLWNDAKHMYSAQGRCYTYFSFWSWSFDDWTLEERLASATTSVVYKTSRRNPSHPVEFGNLSAEALRVLRGTPYLFARKFRADAHLQDYDNVVLKPPGEVEVPRPMLHFMFLAIDSVGHAEIWREFFARAPRKAWRVWLHCKDPAACRNSSFYRLVPGVHIVKKVPTMYCNDLVSAHVQMLEEALCSTAVPPGTMEKFILVSDSTLPVKPFSETYQVLTEHDTSDFCLYPSTQWLQAKVKDTILYAIQHHEWNVLNRADAYTLWTQWAPTWDDDKWPDWNVSLRGASRAVAGRKHLLASEFWYGDPWWACTDELAPFGILYGAFVPGPDGTQRYTGIGTISVHKNREHQGRCRTLVLWNVTSTQDPVQQALVDDPCTDLIRPTWGHGNGSDPAAFGGFGADALRRLRVSDYLFIRKVLPNATLRGYAEIALAEEPKPPAGPAKLRSLQTRCRP
mmetsp:Transcript_50166/g.139335  ORF Transcript_50166/g.139335 Transcript_50166/m.139335 type:complete len:796 (-) Transcript_50166:358-2745(-)